MNSFLLLGRLRLAIRFLYGMHGLGLFVAYLAGLLAVVYVGDRVLDYPRGIRVLQIFLFGSLSAYVFWRLVVRPLAVPITRSDLGVLIERTHPALHERFLTLLQAEEDPEIAATAHPQLLEQVRREALAMQRDISIARVLRPQRALRAAGIGVLAAGAFALGVWSQGELSSIFFQRLLAADLPWPRRTALELVLKDRQGELLATADGRNVVEVEIARSSSLRVEARALGVVPLEARFVTGGARVDKVARQSQDEESSAHFVHTYREVTDDFEFWVEGGDDDDDRPLVRVRTYTAPSIRWLWSTVEPPAYLPTPLARSARQAVPHGNVSALRGSRADLVLWVEGDVTQASAKLEPAPAPEWEERALERLESPPQPPAGLEAQTTDGLVAYALRDIPLEGSTPFQVRVSLSDRKGRAPERPNVYLFTPLADEPPEAHLRLIGMPFQAATPEATLLAWIDASDDHDLAQLDWVVREDHFDVREEDVAVRFERHLLSPDRSFDEEAFLDRRAGRARTEYAFDARAELRELAAAGLPTSPGSLLALFARARDRRPDASVSDSTVLSIAVVDSRDLLERLSTALEEVRAEAEEIRGSEQRFLALLEETRAALGDTIAPGSWTPEDTTFDRAEAASAGRRLAERFSGIAQTVILNRVGVGLDDPQAESAGDRGGGDREVDALQRSLRALLAERGEISGGSRSAAGLDLDLLARLGEKPESISARPHVLALLDIGQDFASLSLEHHPAVQEATRALAELRTADGLVPALDRLLSEQRQALEASRRICQGLQRWDSFERILLDFRRTLDNLIRFRRNFGESDR